MRVLLLGGSKSGKSLLAQSLVKNLAGGGPMIYWATMDPVDGEDHARIARHLQERAGWGFETLECGSHFERVLPLPPGCSVLLDSATAVLANEMFGPEMDENAGERTAKEILLASESAENFVCVCDDIFRDAGRYEFWTECYRKGLARVCRVLAAEFDAVAEVTGGLVRIHKGDLGGLLD